MKCATVQKSQLQIFFVECQYNANVKKINNNIQQYEVNVTET